MMAAWSSRPASPPPRFHSVVWEFVHPNAQPRREVLHGLVGAVAGTFGAQAAWADAYGSKPWALSKYGPKVTEIIGAVGDGNMKALLGRESAMKALNGYWLFSPKEYGEKNKLVAEMMDAAENDDTVKAKALYGRYLSDDVMQQWMAAGELHSKPRLGRSILSAQSSLFSGQDTKGSVDGRGI